MEKRFYIEFRENNFWEGETWTKYIPLENNEEALKLLNWLNNNSRHYHCKKVEFSKEELEKQLKRDNCGYMYQYELYEGILNIEKIKQALKLFEKMNNGEEDGDGDDLFYKMQFLDDRNNWMDNNTSEKKDL